MMITQGQQRVINALGSNRAALVFPHSAAEGPHVLTKDGKVKLQIRTFEAILDDGLIHKSPDGEDFYVLTEMGRSHVQDQNSYHRTPYRR